ncbi:MAG: hypothetical protein HY903_17460 [Deltaproteobacteria bacterium]|nr:hypothetical protein [Deltaproteobacteria bacterium]
MRPVALFCIPLLLTLGACGDPPNDLWGSIDESYALDFDRVDIRKQNLDLLIEYVKALHGGEDKVCKVTVETENLNIGASSDITDDVFKQKVTVERIAAVGGLFPAVTGGQMHFDEFDFKADGTVQGDFTVIFETGRNLFGTFKGKVQIVSTE